MFFVQSRSEHLDILTRWVRYFSKFDLCASLKSRDINTIAIYGGGVLGITLYETLVGSINIKCVIDRNPDLTFPYDVDVVLPEQTECFIGVDAVIVAILPYWEVEKQLSQYVKCLILDNIIINIDEYNLFEKVVQHIKACGAVLLLADLTRPLYKMKNLSFFEKVAKLGGVSWSRFYGNSCLLEYYNDLENCSQEYCDKVFTAKPPISTFRKDGKTYLSDVNLEYFNVINNCRLTTDVPDKYDNTVHFFGNCASVGLYTEDKYTIESNFQRFLNERKMEGPQTNKVFRVVNRANWCSYRDAFPPILETAFLPGDFVVLISQNVSKFSFYCMEDESVKYIDLETSFDRPHEFTGEVFFDDYHVNHRGYKLIAKKLYSEFEKLISAEYNTGAKSEAAAQEIHNPVHNPDVPVHLLSHPREKKVDDKNKGLNEYLAFLRNEKSDAEGVIGAVVVNCNPFTLGHRYIIEEARKNCDFLYVFVVEEDKSFFLFKDRFNCVNEGVADIENVKVLPSGKFIISSLTFPEYFVKESIDVTIDASLDIRLFAEQIAPVLRIKKRFVGNEPLCQVTRQYNNAMAETLPLYGIELVVFNRKEANSLPISASKVRELLKDNKLEELKEYVPNSTFQYLLRFKKRIDN